MTRPEVVGRVAEVLVQAPVRHPLRVAIDGITAVGKTTFANELAEGVRARGRTCLRVSMDGFHQPRSVRYRQGRDSADGHYDDAYDMRYHAAQRRYLAEFDPEANADIVIEHDDPAAANVARNGSAREGL